MASEELVRAHEQRMSRIDLDIRELRESDRSLADTISKITLRNQETASALDKILNRLEDSDVGLRAVKNKANEALELAKADKTDITHRFQMLKVGAIIVFLLMGKDAADRLWPVSGHAATKEDLIQAVKLLLTTGG